MPEIEKNLYTEDSSLYRLREILAKKWSGFIIGNAVHLAFLIGQTSEQRTLRISPPFGLEIDYSRGLAHPNAFYPLICNPLFSFINGLGIKYLLKGSIVRQAAEIILFNRTTRNLVSYILRSFDSPFDNQDLSEEARKMFKELSIESDIDIKFFGNMDKNEKILERSFPYFVERLANLIVYHYSLWKLPRQEAKNFYRLGKKAKKDKPIKKEDFSIFAGKVKKLEPDNNIICAYRVIPAVLQVSNFLKSLPKGFTPEQIEQLIEIQSGYLIIYVKKIKIRDIMPVYKLIFAVERDDGSNKFIPDYPINESDLQPFFSIDFSQTFPQKDAAKYDNRVGPGCNTHEITGRRLTMPVALLGDIRDGSFNQEFVERYEHTSPSIYIYVPRRELESFKKPVALGLEWENKTDLDCLETFGRAVFQAIEFGINNPDIEEDYFDLASLDRAKNRFRKLTINEVDKRSYQFDSFTFNIIKSFLINPHKTIEYLGKSGLWDLLFEFKLKIKWSEALNKLNQLETESSYQNKIIQILNNLTNRGRYNGEDFSSGLFLLDRVFELERLIPDLKSHHERIYRLFID